MATPPESTSIPFPVEAPTDDKPPPPRKRSAFASRSNLPFARSALNRNSVMCLPSIAHLQHGFAKMGIKEANSAGSSSSSLGKTAGGGGGRKSIAEMVGGPLTVEETQRARRRTFDIGQASSFDDEEENDGPTLDTLGPEPEKPELDTRMPWEKTGDVGRVVKDEKELRSQVHQDVEHVCDKWGLINRTASSSQRRRQSRSSYASSGSTAVNPLSSSSSSSSRPLSPSALSESTLTSSSANEVPLVLDLLTTTNAAIRSVQSWIVSLPLSSPATLTFDDPLQVSTAARPRTSLALPVSVSSRPNPSTQHLSRQSSSTSSTTESNDPNDGEQLVNALRRQTLQVLGMLRDLESKHQSSARSLEPSSTEFPSFPSSSTETNEDLKERSANYDPSVLLETLELEANVVDEWIEAVERVVEYIERRKRLERRKEGSFVQSGRDEDDRNVRDVQVGEGSEDEEEKEVLPSWAEKDGFETPLDRASLLLATFLPSSLPSPSASLNTDSRDSLLDLLSSGTLLCKAYNSVLTSSSRPFGFIPEYSIHELSPPASTTSSTVGSSDMMRSCSTTSEGETKVGTTFRRVENLQVWAGSLKHRYSINVSTLASLEERTEPTLIGFDARSIATRKEGTRWKGMLELAVGAWAEAVAKEKRDDFFPLAVENR